MRTPDVELSLDDIRAVTRFASACASTAIEVFHHADPDDSRPRAALQAAVAFADGGRRTRTLRTTAVAAHRAAKEATGLPAHHAAMAAGDAAASAYLHPLADVAQVGHVLRAAAHAALARPDCGETSADELVGLADDRLRSVLARYPRTRPGTTPAGRLVHHLDGRLRT